MIALEFKKIFKSVYTKIYLLFSSFPIFLILMAFLSPQTISIDTSGNLPINFFVLATQSISFDLYVPNILLVSIVSIITYKEIKEQYIYSFNSGKFSKLFNAKLCAVIIYFLLYSVCLIISSIIAYYITINFTSLLEPNVPITDLLETIITYLSLLGKNIFFIYISFLLSFIFSDKIVIVITIIIQSIIGVLASSNKFYTVFLFNTNPIDSLNITYQVLIITSILIIYTLIYVMAQKLLIKKALYE